jgi:beta-N-acetylhexosaminidase
MTRCAGAAGYGTHTYESNSPTTPHSIFDVASLTKVMATVPAVMLLYEAGKLGTLFAS